jgi:hypothetical protein
MIDIELNPEDKLVILPNLGYTIRQIQAVILRYNDTAAHPRRRWKLLYRESVVGEVRVTARPNIKE